MTTTTDRIANRVTDGDLVVDYVIERQDDGNIVVDYVIALCVCRERGYCADVPGDPAACSACVELDDVEACPAT